MKKCIIHSTAQNKEADAVIIDGHVLVAAPRTDNIAPEKIIDGVCYYPPRYGANLARDMNYMPFSVECEWGEFGECWKEYSGEYVSFKDENDDDDSDCADPNDPRPMWAILYGINDIPEKWGYCDAYNGKIREAPQWEHCEDFNDEGFGRVKGHLYGVQVDTFFTDYGVFLWPSYRDIMFAADNIILVQSDFSGHWGAYCAPDWERYAAIQVEWDGIWYEEGFFTVMRRGKDGSETYALLNAYQREPFIGNLTERPARYVPERCTHYDGEARFASYYFINREEERGLVCGYPGNGGMLMQEPTIIKHPVYTYNHLCRMVSRDMQETEIAYYACLMSRTPKHFPMRGGDGWDSVPGQLRDKVREYMAEKGWTQPETAADI